MDTHEVVKAPYKVLARGLGWPHGPTVAPDGRIFFVETFRGQVSVWESGRDLYSHAHTGGGPQACVLNMDDSLLVAQNGGITGTWRAEKRMQPSIQWVSADGHTVQEFVTEVDGIRVNGPRDLVWSTDEWLYFSDYGDYGVENPEPSRLFRVNESGVGELLMEIDPPCRLDGVAFSNSGSIIWVESPTGLVKELSDAEVRVIAQLPDPLSAAGGISISTDNHIYVTSITGECIDVISMSGEHIRRFSCGGLPTTCVFDECGNLIVTDAGVLPDSTYPQFLGNLLLVDLNAVSSTIVPDESEDDNDG